MSKKSQFNPFQEKLNVGIAIQEIGYGKEIRLVFDEHGHFMVTSGNMDYYPTSQGKLSDWKYETALTLKKEDCGDWDWPKYAAEEMLSEISEQQKTNGLRVVL